MTEQEPPKVFISYSHDSAEHIDQVLELANQLRAEGIDCDIDQYVTSPPEGWPNWMERRLRWADFVLMVCTETYGRRVGGDESEGVGRGVKWEGRLISQAIYQSDSLNTRFIPVVFSDADRQHIPHSVAGASFYLLDRDYESLYRHLTGQPETLKPELGKLRSLPPRPRKSFPDQDDDASDGTKPHPKGGNKSVDLPGKARLVFSRSLEDNWGDLAELLKIPPYDQRRFKQGDEARSILAWLENRRRLGELLDALRETGLNELADEMLEIIENS